VERKSLNKCKTCGRDMNKLNSKRIVDAIKLTYEGVGTFMQIKCKCGMQTKKVLVGSEVSARDIWNGTIKKKK